MLKMSIVVAVYNTEKYLKKCLDSIEKQNYKNLEVLMVNDGSTDASGKILREYMQKDKRFKLFEQENQGPGGAKNTGLENATGDYIIFIDSDDWIENDFIEKMLKKAEEKDYDIVYCDWIEEDEQGKQIKIGKISENKDKTLEEIVKMNMTEKIPCGASRKIIKREIIEHSRARFSTMLSGEEFYYTLKTILEAKNVGFTQGVYYHYVQRKASQSRLKNNLINDSNIIVLKEVLEKENLLEEYKDIYQTKIVVRSIIDIYNCCQKNSIFKVNKDSRNIIKEYKNKYKDDYNIKNIELEYADKRIQIIYPFFRRNLFIVVYLFSKIYDISKRIRNKPL